jgi:hypothetical protein
MKAPTNSTLNRHDATKQAFDRKLLDGISVVSSPQTSVMCFKHVDQLAGEYQNIVDVISKSSAVASRSVELFVNTKRVAGGDIDDAGVGSIEDYAELIALTPLLDAINASAGPTSAGPAAASTASAGAASASAAASGAGGGGKISSPPTVLPPSGGKMRGLGIGVSVPVPSPSTAPAAASPVPGPLLGLSPDPAPVPPPPTAGALDWSALGFTISPVENDWRILKVTSNDNPANVIYTLNIHTYQGHERSIIPDTDWLHPLYRIYDRLREDALDYWITTRRPGHYKPENADDRQRALIELMGFVVNEDIPKEFDFYTANKDNIITRSKVIFPGPVPLGAGGVLGSGPAFVKFATGTKPAAKHAAKPSADPAATATATATATAAGLSRRDKRKTRASAPAAVSLALVPP